MTGKRKHSKAKNGERPSRGRNAKAAKRSARETAAEASSSSAPAAEPQGPSALDVLPDELLLRILLDVSHRDWKSLPLCTGISLLDPDDGPQEADLERLGPFRAVCRRFRRLIDDPSAVDRLAMKYPTDAVVRLVAPRRLSSLTLAYARLRSPGLRSLLLSPALRETLRELDLTLDGKAEPPLAALAVLPQLEQLRGLGLSTDKETRETFHTFCGLPFQRSLARLARLPLERLHLFGVPMTLRTLRALRPLAPTLRGLLVDAVHFQGDSVRPLVEAVAAFARLETLAFAPRMEGRDTWPEALEADLQPLRALADLRVLELRCWVSWLGFLAAMPRLEHLGLSCGGEALDFAPLRDATSLRSLSFSHEPMSPNEAVAAAGALRGLTSLEALDLQRVCFEALAGEPLACWGRLRTLQLAQYPYLRPIPLVFLQRVGADAAALEELRTASPLPQGGAALLRGPRFRRLAMVGPAAATAGTAARERVRAELPPSVELSFDAGAEGAGEGEPGLGAVGEGEEGSEGGSEDWEGEAPAWAAHLVAALGFNVLGHAGGPAGFQIQHLFFQPPAP